MGFRYFFMALWGLSVLGAVTIQPLLVWSALLNAMLFTVYWTGEMNDKLKALEIQKNIK